MKPSLTSPASARRCHCKAPARARVLGAPARLLRVVLQRPRVQETGRKEFRDRVPSAGRKCQSSTEEEEQWWGATVRKLGRV